MRRMPREAQIFVILVYLAGLIAVASTFIVPRPHARAEHWELLVFLVLAIGAGSKKVRLTPRRTGHDVGSMSLGFALTFACMLRFGPAEAVLIGCMGIFFGCLYPKRQPLYQILFNVSLMAWETWLASNVFLWINNGSLDIRLPFSFPSIVASSVAYFIFNTGGVAMVIALCTKQAAFPLWKQTFLWTGPSYFAGACVSTLAIMMFDKNIGTILLFVSPVAYITYQSYAITTARAQEKQQHIEELQVSQAQLADLYLATIKSLALAIDAKDPYTHQHILRVQKYAVAISEKMGLSGDDLQAIETGALLHDIGKLGVPEYVLLKPGRLTEEEFAKIKEHPRIGADILDPVEFPWPVLPAVKYHHEKWDGTGYPEGLKGEEIPLQGRILAVADVYDALTSPRSYRAAWTHEKAIEEIRAGIGTHFDPVIAEAFLEIIESIVQEMAAEGTGPLVAQQGAAKPATSKADEAARDIMRASSELWALYEVAQTLSSSLGLQETLDILARKLEAIVPRATCLFLLREEQSESLTAQAVFGVTREFFEGCRTLDGKSVSLAVAETRQTYLGEYNQDDLLLTSARTVPWVALQAALIVPIVHQDKVLGTINLYHPDKDAFGPHDQQLLEMIAERAAMALYNGILFDRTRSHALTDPLTGLFNVRHLTQCVEERCRAAAESDDRPEADAGGERQPSDFGPLRTADSFALLCLDLDSFKPINDNFGHQKGDQVLIDLAKIFRTTVRREDIVARYGGDEFLIVLHGAGAFEAQAMAERLQRAVERYDPGLIHPRLGALHLGVSIGIATFPSDGRDCATLLSVADASMYREKTERKLGSLADRGTARAGEPDGQDSRERLPIAA